MDTSTVRESTPEVSAREVRLHACLGDVVYIGHPVEEDGEEVEIFYAYPCSRCQSAR